MSKATTQFHRRGLRCASLVAVACLALGLGATTAHANRFFGVVNPFLNRCDGSQQQGNCLSTGDLRRMSQVNMKVVRWGFRWALIQPERGAYRWTIPDQVIGALASRGIRVLPVVTGTPPWVGGKYGAAPVNSRLARKSWRRFLKASVERYGPGGDYWTDPSLYRQTHPTGPIKSIGTWQIWNEQNIRGGAQHVPPGAYARLVAMSHRAIRAADPKARILLGGMPGYVKPRGWRYLNELYDHRGFKHQFDAVAVHPYAGDVGPVFIQIRQMRRVMRQHGDARKPLWVTELGWGSKRPSKSQPINKGPRGQRKFLSFVFPLLRKYHKRWHIPHVFWFRWRDPPPNTAGCTFCSSSGLFHHDQKPKPSWKAFRHISRHR